MEVSCPRKTSTVVLLSSESCLEMRVSRLDCTYEQPDLALISPQNKFMDEALHF